MDGTTVRDDSPKEITPEKVRSMHCPGLSVSPFWSSSFPPSPLTGATCTAVHVVAVLVVEELETVEVLEVLDELEELDEEVELEAVLDEVLEAVVEGRTGAKTTSFFPIPHPWYAWPFPPSFSLFPLLPLFPSPSPCLVVLVDVDVDCEELEVDVLDVEVLVQS